MSFRIAEEVFDGGITLARVVPSQIVERGTDDRYHQMLDAAHLLQRATGR